MVTKDEALHKALKVLNCLNNGRVYETAWVKGAINACEEALEQPAIEQGEPVAWYWDNNHRDKIPFAGIERGSPKMDAIFGTPIPLYTAPPQKQWVDLTDDEISRIWFAVEHEVKTHILYGKHLAKAIQAKFKELNT